MSHAVAVSARLLPVVALLGAASALPGAAHAQDYTSEAQDATITSVTRAYDNRIPIPLVFDVVTGCPFGGDIGLRDLGVTVTVNSAADLAINMEGEVNLGWPDPNGVGEAALRVEPSTAGTQVGFRGGFDFDIVFGFIIESCNITSPIPIQFSLLSAGTQFAPTIGEFLPYLLPFQQTISQNIFVSANTLIDETLSFPFTLGIVRIEPGVNVQVTPVADTLLSGESLDFVTDDDIFSFSSNSFTESVFLYEQEPTFDGQLEYNVTSRTEVGFQVDVDGSVELGIDVGFTVLSIPFTFNLFSDIFYIPGLGGFESLSFTSDAISIPLPMVNAPLQEVNFGNVAVGEEQTITVPFNNDGEWELYGEVAYEGDAAFTVSPIELFADAGGQDGTVVRFAPTEVGDFEGEIVLINSDPVVPEIVIPITGKGVRRVRDEENPLNPDNGGQTGGPRTIYEQCGCASTTSPAGTLPLFAGLVGLIALRRRRQG